jgi:hypothetical protein
MKSFYKVALATAVLVLGSALPVMSQIDNGMDFTTSFPFYAGNAKMSQVPTRSPKPTLTRMSC